MNFSYRKLYGVRINNCHYESVTANVQMPLYKKIKGFVVKYGLSGKLWILTGVLLPYLYITQIHVFSIRQETMTIQKIFN